MNMKRTFAAAIAALSLAGPALAGPVLNDLEIAHAAYTADEIDIRYAHLALALSENKSVREFAQTMIRDHTAVNEAAVALLTELNVQPQDNDLSMALVKGSESKILELSGLKGNAFDCAYAQNEAGYHIAVNKVVADTFIPQVTVAPLGDLLADAQVTFNQHEVLAKKMAAGLTCRS